MPVYTGIRKKEKIIMDVSEQLADCIFMNVTGVAAHLLSEKIYTEKEVELDEREIEILKSCMGLFTGVFATSLNEYLNDKIKEKED